MTEPLFWVAALAMLYVYGGYPLILACLAAFRPLRSRASQPLPRVSVVVPCYNEERVIEAKLSNALASAYPADRLQVIVVSDGSRDRTVQAARNAAGTRALVIERPSRRGKAEALNAAIGAATGEILVFTDANVLFEPDALHRLTEPFAEAKTGCVVGRVLLTPPRSGEPAGEGLYMRYERWLHAQESRLGTMIGIDGALFAVRRELYSPLPSGAIVEDFIAGLRCLEQGYRIRFEPRAVGYEEAAASVADEFRRKARMIAGGFQALWEFRRLLNPVRHPLVSWALVSHKLLRWFVPFLLAIALVTNLLLLPKPLYVATLAAQVFFYACSGVAWGLPGARRLMPFYVPYYFCAVNLAALVGLGRFLARSQSVLWEKPAR